jgi:hypothetical protein
MIRSSVKHLHGPKKIAYARDELVVVCLVRNGRPYVKSFIDHYLTLGAKHMVFLDNDSDDGTVAVARNHERVTVLQTRLPFKKYHYAMKQYLISRFGKGRWCLYVDIDELFDYPYSDVVDLGSLLRYLNEKSYTAVVAQMLDMFPDRALSTRVSQKDEPLKELYKFYDLSKIKRVDYHGGRGQGSNVIANNDIKIIKGGVRWTYIRPNSTDVRFMLTKHPLIFGDAKARHEERGLHRIRNARVADLSCVLYHYKFIDGFRERVARAVQEENYAPGNTSYYKEVHKLLKRNPSIRLGQDTARELKSVNELVGNGFLVVSDEYRRWAEAEKEGKAATS